MSRQPFQIQRQYGPYRVLAELGRGGQGVVLHARQDALSRDVALKLLFGQEERTRKRFVREARTLARLRHPNLPNVFDVGEAQGTAYIAMEHVRGVSLKDYVRSRGVPDAEWTRRVLGQIARAVHFCHTNGVLHRDLKPSNILLEERTERPVLIDFGLITIERGLADGDLSFADRTRLSLSGELKGTPHYMSPEQAHPEEGPVTPRSDVYSLGGVLYFLLTGQEPFGEKDSLYAVLIGLMQEEPVDPLSYAPKAPADLVATFRRAMARRPEERFLSADELADALAAPAAASGRVRPALALLAALALGGLGIALPLLALGSEAELGGARPSASSAPSRSAASPAATLAGPPTPVAPQRPEPEAPPSASPSLQPSPAATPREGVQPDPLDAPDPLEPSPTWVSSARRGGSARWERELPGGAERVLRAGPWTLAERKKKGWFALDAEGKLHQLGQGGAWTWDPSGERLLGLRGDALVALDPRRPGEARELARARGGHRLALSAGRIWVGARGSLTCLDARGQEQWRREHPFRVEAPPLPLTREGQQVVLVVDARGAARLLAGETGDELARLELGAPARCPLIALRSGRVALASGNGRIALLEAGPAELKQVRVLDVHEPLLSPLIEGPEGQLYVTGRRGLYALSSELEVLWYGPPARGWGEVVEGPQLCDLDGDGRVEVAQVFQGERHQRGLCVYDRGGAELLWVELDERALVASGPGGSLVSAGQRGARRWGAAALERPPAGMNLRRSGWQLMAGAWRRAARECPRLGPPVGPMLAALARAHLGDPGPARALGKPAFDQVFMQVLAPTLEPPRPAPEQFQRLVTPFGGAECSQLPARPLREPPHVPWKKGPALGAIFPWGKRPVQSNGLRVRLPAPFPARAWPRDRRELRFELEAPAELLLRIEHKVTRGEGRQFAELELRLDGQVLVPHLEGSWGVVRDGIELPALAAGEHLLELNSTARSLTVHKLNRVVLEPR